MTINIQSEKLLQWVQTILLVAILGLLIWQQPWSANVNSQTRKVTVTGDATIESTPDEYVFSPYFQESGSDKDVLKKSLTKKTNDAVAELKKLGVAEEDIKVDASSYEYWVAVEGEKNSPMTVSIQVTVNDKELAQKVQDYFTTLDLEGQLTPIASFSTEKQKELDTQAVDKATEDAKKKAEQQATLLNAKLGKVIEVNQDSNSVMPIAYDATVSSGSSRESGTIATSAIEILPGQNEYTKSITVTYELK